MPGVSYRDLLVWQKAIQLVLECYTLTESLPLAERYGLSVQIRRATV
jgi:four helix bundle protein